MSATFTGSSYLSIASVPASQTLKGSAVSFAIWVRPTSGGGTLIDTGTLGYYCGIVSANVDPGPPVNFMDTIAIFNDTGAGTLFLDLEQNEFAEELVAQGPSTVTNTWVHYAATYDGSNTSAGQKIYVNGTLFASTNTGSPVTSTIAWNRVVVGGFNGDGQDCFIYNRVLTAGEISDLYLGRTQRVNTANIVGHWPLYGDNLGLDISGQGRNLSATGTVVAGTNHAPTSTWFPGSTRALRTLAVSTTTAITAEGDLKSAGSGSLFNLVSASGNVSSAGSGSLVNLISATGNVQSAGSASAQNLVSATGAIQSAGSASAQNLISATGAVQSAASASAQNLIAASGDVHSAGSASLQNLVSATGAVQSAASGTATEAVALNGSGSVQSAASGLPFQLASATGAIQSAAAGTLVSIIPLTATGAVQSAATASPQNLVSASGDEHSAGSGTLGAGLALSGSGGVQSAGAGAPFNLVSASGAIQSAATATAQSLVSASGNIASAATGVVLNLFSASGGIASAASGTLAATYLMTGTGGIQSAGFGTLTGGTTPTVTGGPFKGNVSRRTMYAGRRRMRIV